MKKFLKNARSYIQRNALVLSFALLVGALSVAPHILAWHALGDSYQGMPFFHLDNEDYYLDRIHEITDGHYLVGSPLYFEYKSTVQIIPPVGEYFYILLRLLTGASLANTLVIAKFLFPALLFLLVYGLVHALTRESGSEYEQKWGAIAAALMVTLGCELVDYQLLLSRLLHGSTSNILSVWTRPVNPITGAFFLFAFLLILWKNVKKLSWKYSIASGIALGFSIGYIFSFGTGLSVLGTLIIFSLLAKEYQYTKQFLITLVVSIVIPALYWINVLPQLLGGSDTAGRNGLMLMHTPFFNKVLIAVSVLFAGLLLFARKRGGINICRDRKAYLPLWFALAFLFAGFAVLNQQILTGRTIWPYHFVQYTIPLAMVASYVALFFLLRPFAPRIWKGIIGASIVICILFSVWNAHTYIYGMKDFREFQEFAPTFSWLNTYAQKDCVVLVSGDPTDRLTLFIPGFTHCNIYLSDNVMGSVPVDRVHYDLLVRLRMEGVKGDDVEQYLRNDDEELAIYYSKDWFELFDLNHNRDRLHALIPAIASEYREFYAHDFEAELKKYRIDYVIARGELNADAKKALPHLSEVYRTGSTTIYQLP